MKTAMTSSSPSFFLECLMHDGRTGEWWVDRPGEISKAKTGALLNYMSDRIRHRAVGVGACLCTCWRTCKRTHRIIVGGAEEKEGQ